jgi:hypothetical protein
MRDSEENRGYGVRPAAAGPGDPQPQGVTARMMQQTRDPGSPMFSAPRRTTPE